MGGQLVIRGVPASLTPDGWWFLDEAEADAPVAAGAPVVGQRGSAGLRHLPPAALGAVALLVALADGLFWSADPGVSVALYALALAACMLALKPGGVTLREGTLAMAFTLVCNLPVMEQMQALSLGFSGAGLIALLAWIAFGRITGAGQVFVLFLRASFIGALVLPLDAFRELREAKSGAAIKRAARALALPVGIGLVFGLLFTFANPLIENALAQIDLRGLPTAEQIKRVLFWGFAACALWPYLNTQGQWWRERAKTSAPARAETLRDGALINAASVRASLVLFNVMFAVQTLTDLGVLTGGMALPDGMTYAQYAHRGACPLVVTALLSGAFALATHRRVADNRVLRGLMYLWLGQNLFLVLTAMFRLSLYVEAYTLTYMRVAAFIWMGLVFVALALIVVQMAQGRPLAWLIRSNMIAVTSTLYACCFVNFAYVIADYNISATAPGESLDLAYLCNLGEQAIPAMMDFGQITDTVTCGRGPYPALRFDPIDDWREWGFRRWRLQRYLETYHDL